jgi:hypothetical protein
MSAHGGPNIVEDGLVLALDAANEKSFRGEPTVNLANSNFARTIQFHNQSAYGNAGTISDAPERGAGWKKITITNRGNNFRIAQFPYISHPTSTTRTYSVEVDFGITSGYYIRIDGFSGSAGNSSSGKIFITFTTTTNSGSLALFLNHNTSNVSGISDVIYYRYYQVENKPYPTPFTEGTRGTTVATGGGWADRSGNSNHGELVNGPTFDSDNGGSLVFDGVNDTVNFNYDLRQDFTYECWALHNVVNGFAFLGQGPTTTRSGLHIWFRSDVNSVIRFGMFNNDTDASITTSTGIWYHYCFTYNHSTFLKQIYRNGVALSTTPIQTQSSYLGTGVVRIGATYSSVSSGFANGRISLSKLYNRVLTAQEIQQNYNATKGRYGL